MHCFFINHQHKKMRSKIIIILCKSNIIIEQHSNFVAVLVILNMANLGDAQMRWNGHREAITVTLRVGINEEYFSMHFAVILWAIFTIVCSNTNTERSYYLRHCQTSFWFYWVVTSLSLRDGFFSVEWLPGHMNFGITGVRLRLTFLFRLASAN